MPGNCGCALENCAHLAFLPSLTHDPGKDAVMTDDDRKLMLDTLAAGLRSVAEQNAGVLWTLNFLVNELLEQGVLDSGKLLDSMAKARRALTDAGDVHVAKAFEVMTATVLRHGDGHARPAWLDELITH
jgi:hypothetical protein